MTTNFNTDPYFDDYSEDAKFLKVLFRPGYPVQTRELNQIQSILQNQVARQGKALYTEGSMIIPGGVTVDTNVPYIQVSGDPAVATSFVGKKITNAAGLTAEVLLASTDGGTLGTDSITLFLKYTNTKIVSNANVSTYVATDIVYVIGTPATTLTVKSSPTGDAATVAGTGSLVSIQRGIYYVYGSFVQVDTQTIVLDKYTSLANYRVGLQVVETLTTPESDTTLLDNSQGTYNYAAPGAHRYSINLVLTRKALSTVSTAASTTAGSSAIVLTAANSLIKVGQTVTGIGIPFNATVVSISGTSLALSLPATGTGTSVSLNFDFDDGGFIELLRSVAGVTQRIVDSTDFSELQNLLASRTYDQSGDFTVNNFNLDIREYRDNNRGLYVSGRYYLPGDVVSTTSGRLYVCRHPTGDVSTGSEPTVDLYTSPNTYLQTVGTVSWEHVKFPTYNRGVYPAPATTTPSDHTTPESKLVLNMEPGKAYIRGYKVEKVATTPVETKKSREIVQRSSATISGAVGNYLYVTNVYSLPFNSLSDAYISVNLYPKIYGSSTATVTNANYSTVLGQTIGTARARYFEFDSGTLGTQSAVYKLSLFDIKMNAGSDFARDVKSISNSTLSATAALNFVADINPVVKMVSGTLITTSGNNGVTGAGTAFLTELKAGDYIRYNISSTTTPLWEIRQVTNIFSQTSLNMGAVASATFASGTSYGLMTTSLYETNASSLIFPLPDTAVASARNGASSKIIQYTTQVYVNQTAVGTALNVTSPNSENWASVASNTNYTFFSDVTGKQIIPVSISASTTSLTVVLPAANSGEAIRFIGSTIVTGSTSLNEKSKTKTQASQTFTTAITATPTNITLTNADGYRLIGVFMDTGTFGAPTGLYNTDISERFIFDNGQKDTHYGLSQVIRGQEFAAPTAPIKVIYEFFAHGSGDYCSVNSYSSINYSSIPYFGSIRLSDVLDFRPRVNDTGTFTTGTASVTRLPRRGIDISLDYQAYLLRNDKVSIDNYGTFRVSSSASAINPAAAEAPIGMMLYDVSYNAYTFGTTTADVRVKSTDNRRYTMRDIGKLESRINSLEYYTSLSLLEVATASSTITDSSGLNRFKNGFFVDNFASQSGGDSSSGNYQCSIDIDNKELRPFYSMDNVNLIESIASTPTSDATRAANGYKLWGDFITIKTDASQPDVKIISQPYGSRAVSVNPFAVYTFVGDGAVYPSSDDWFEVQRKPDIIQNVEGNYSAVLASKGGLSTVYGAWNTVWTGNPTTVSTNATWASTTTTTAQDVTTAADTFVFTESIAKTLNSDVLESSSVIPFIRSRNILGKVTNLKPASRFYAYFDGVLVDSFITPATVITLTGAPTGGKFDFNTNAGNNAGVQQRMILGDTQVCLNRGDVIQTNAGGTAVVVGYESTISVSGVTTYYVYVHNVKGTLAGGTNAITVISGINTAIVTATISSVSTPTYITSSLSGEANFIFNIPNTDSVRFRTGTRVLTLVDALTGTPFSSRVQISYSAKGRLDVYQANYTATRNASYNFTGKSFSTTNVVTTTTVNNDWDIWGGGGGGNSGDGNGSDPLAQTFFVDNEGGVILSKVDLFFAAKNVTSNIPVRIEIREVVNGFPGSLVIPNSSVIVKNVDVKISSTTVTDASGLIVNASDTPTTINFPGPVALRDKTQYALVILSESNEYFMWISQLGDRIPNSTRTISEQPNLGVLFKSQNASTWSEDQSQDLMFNLYRANFDIGTASNTIFVNDNNSYVAIEDMPFETQAGSNKIRVWHKDHGFVPGQSVIIQAPLTASGTNTITVNNASTAVTAVVGLPFTSSWVGVQLYTTAGVYIGMIQTYNSTSSVTLASAYTGTTITGVTFLSTIPINPTSTSIPAYQTYNYNHAAADPSVPFSTFTVADVDTDSYTYTVTATTTGLSLTIPNAALSGYFGTGIRANRNIKYELINPYFQVVNFPETKVEFTMKGFNTQSVDYTTGNTPQTNTFDAAYSGITPNNNNLFLTPKVVLSKTNESLSNSGNKSLSIIAALSSTNKSLSPILDTHRISAIVVSNKINNPTDTNTNITGLDDRTVISASTGINYIQGSGAATFKGTAATTTTLTVNSITSGTISVGQRLVGPSVPANTYIVGMTGATTGGVGTYTMNQSLTFTDIDIFGIGSTVYDGTSSIYNTDNNNTTAQNLMQFNPGKYITITGSGTTGPTATTGTATQGTSLITLASTINAFVGQIITGTGIAGSTYITAINVGTGVVTVSNPVTAALSTTAVTLTPLNDGKYLVRGTKSLAAGVTQVIIQNVNTIYPLTPVYNTPSTTIKQFNQFVSEIAPVGSTTISKYVTKRINLINPCSFIKLNVAAKVPNDAAFDIYYKTSTVGQTGNLDLVNFTLMNPDTTILRSTNFIDYSFTLANLPSFDGIVVKIVMRSGNAASVPSLKNLRMVFCA